MFSILSLMCTGEISCTPDMGVKAQMLTGEGAGSLYCSVFSVYVYRSNITLLLCVLLLMFTGQILGALDMVDSVYYSVFRY